MKAGRRPGRLPAFICPRPARRAGSIREIEAAIVGAAIHDRRARMEGMGNHASSTPRRSHVVKSASCKPARKLAAPRESPRRDPTRTMRRRKRRPRRRRASRRRSERAFVLGEGGRVAATPDSDRRQHGVVAGRPAATCDNVASLPGKLEPTCGEAASSPPNATSTRRLAAASRADEPPSSSERTS